MIQTRETSLTSFCITFCSVHSSLATPVVWLFLELLNCASASVLWTCFLPVRLFPPDSPTAQFLTSSWSLLSYPLPEEASLIAVSEMAPALIPLYLALFSFVALFTIQFVIFKNLDGSSWVFIQKGSWQCTEDLLPGESKCGGPAGW